MEDKVMLIATKISGQTDEELQTLLMSDEKLVDNWDEVLLGLAEKKVSKIKDGIKDVEQEFFDKGFQKAEKKVKQSNEKILSEKFGISEYESYEDLVEKIQSKKPVKGDLTDDQIKGHPLYVELEKNTIPKDKYSELETTFNEFKTGIEKNKIYGDVKNKAKSMLMEKNPIGRDKGVIFDNRLNDWLSKFESYDYDVTDNDIIIKKDGKRVEDKLGNALGFDDMVSNMASNYFEFEVQDPKGSPGQKGGAAYNGAMPKTEEEYQAMINDRSIPLADRMKINEQWKNRK